MTTLVKKIHEFSPPMTNDSAQRKWQRSEWHAKPKQILHSATLRSGWQLNNSTIQQFNNSTI